MYSAKKKIIIIIKQNKTKTSKFWVMSDGNWEWGSSQISWNDVAGPWKVSDGW